MSRGFTEPDVGVIGFPIALHYDWFQADRQVVGYFFMNCHYTNRIRI